MWPNAEWKIARRCGAKHICKSKCTWHSMLGPLLEVEMSEQCTPLWREAHFEVKMYKTQHSQTTFGSGDVEKVHAVVARSTCGSQNAHSTACPDHLGSWDVEKVHAVVARSTFRSQKCKKLTGSEHFWTFRCRFARQAPGIPHVVKVNKKVRGFVAVSTTNTTLQDTELHYTTLQLQLHYITLQ